MTLTSTPALARSARARENWRVTGASTKAKVSKVIVFRARRTALNMGGKKASPLVRVRIALVELHGDCVAPEISFLKTGEPMGTSFPNETSTRELKQEVSDKAPTYTSRLTASSKTLSKTFGETGGTNFFLGSGKIILDAMEGHR